MKMSRRALRMKRHHKRFKMTASLNMVSLMDIFTILVFFLLVNSSDVETLPSTKAVRLPESVAEKAPNKVLACKVISSDLHSPELEGRISARVMSFDFGAKDVDVTLATYPIDFSLSS